MADAGVQASTGRQAAAGLALGAALWISGMGVAAGSLVRTALFGCLDFALRLEPPAGYGRQMAWLSDATVRRAQGVFYDAAQFGNVCAFFLVGVAVLALAERAFERRAA